MSIDDKKFITVIVPVYNEGPSVARALRTICSVPPYKEVIVVDDGSSDDSANHLATFQSEVANTRPDMLKQLKVIRKTGNEGKGAAVRTALKEAKGEIVLIQDADLELDPNEYPRLLEPFEKHGAHVVFGSRFRREGIMRVHHTVHFLGNKLLTWLSNFCTGLYVTDMETGYKVFKREILQSFPIRSNRFGMEPELTARVAKAVKRDGLNFYEVPISYRPRTYAEGKKIGFKDGLSAIAAIVYFNFFDS